MKNTILTFFLNELHIKHTASFADKLYWEHPYRHTLFGLYDMLKVYNIESIGVNITDKCLDEVEAPFIVHTGKEFAVVRKLVSNEVLYWENGKNINTSLDSFRKIWTGFALLAEKNENTKEPDFKKHLIAYWGIRFTNFLPLLLLALIVVIKYILNFHLVTTAGHAWLILNMLGIIIGILLLNKQVHGLGKYADKVCSLFKYGDCNSVLDSPAAKLWGIFSWSEIGISYFISNLFLLVFFPYWENSLALLNLLTLPYTIWSVWYQYRVVKQWCPLCLSVVILLWFMFVVNVVLGNLTIHTLSIDKFFFTGVIYLLMFSSLHWITTKVIRLQQLEYDSYELNRFKKMENVFLSQLQQSSFYKSDKNSSNILFGNPEAKLCVTFLTNPYCGPCAQMHKRIDNLLKKAGENICIRYIFSSFSKELEIGARLLIAVYMEKTKEEAMDIYNEWFAGKKYLGKEYLETLKINIDSEKVFQELEFHNAWRYNNGLTITPTIIVNNYLLPESYKIEDLEYFVVMNKK